MLTPTLRLAAWTLFLGAAAQAASFGPPRGHLVIVGGGKVGPEIVQEFVTLAGGPSARFVVIPTAGEDRDLDAAKTKDRFATHFGVTNVTVLHTRDRAEADSEAFVAPLLTANAVWFDGGRQWRLADSYLNTRTEREIKAVLARGGVVGGSSAGATIQGSYLVRGAPEGNAIMMAKGHEEGFGLLEKSAIDQHLITRHRENDLVPVVDRHPGLLGIGLDESTAIVVERARFHVVGASKVAIYDHRDHDGKKYYFLAPGQSFNLETLAPEN